MSHFKTFVTETKTDNLTGLYQREVIVDYVESLVEHNIPFSYGIIDVDNFKLINDTYGHHVGDVVLRAIAQQLYECMGDVGVIGRYGGDEFIMVFEGLTEYDDQWNTCSKLLHSMRPIFYSDNESILVTYTMGMAKFPFDAQNANDIFELSDKALYRGKMKGRNCFIIYLEAKHKNIDLKSIRDKLCSQMFLHLKLQTILAAEGDKSANIKAAMEFVGSQLMTDQLILQRGGKAEFLYVNPISAVKEPVMIDERLLKDATAENMGFFWENSLEMSARSDDELHKTLMDYGVYSTVIVDISAFGRSYGYLRADMILKGASRIWQERDLSVLIDLSHKIALIEYINDKN